MMDEISQTVLSVAEPTRRVLSNRVDEMLDLRHRVGDHLDGETKRWLSGLPQPSRQIAGDLVAAGGKRVRPMLSFLIAGACGGDWIDARPVAVAVELLHTGTLLHDDVIDKSDTRRGIPAAHVDWDNSVAILTGDFCYFAALDALLTLRDVTTMECAMGVARALAHGELLQLQRIRQPPPSLTVDECFEVMKRKTACLFEFAGLAAARAVGAPSEVIEAAASFGDNLGMAFQVIDDVLDYVGEGGRLGKASGQDLAHGCITLPLVIANEEQPGLISALQSGELPLAEVHRQVLASSALPRTRAIAADFTGTARAALKRLAPTEEREALSAIADELERRAS